MSKENILVCVAWPYANADIHQGNVTGSYLPADIYARFHRLKGNNVLMVSGSDSHGTPVTVSAEARGETVQETFEYYHDRFLQVFEGMGLSYDLFTHTDTENHHEVSQQIFKSLLKNEYLYTKGDQADVFPLRPTNFCRTAMSKGNAPTAAMGPRVGISVTTATPSLRARPS